MKHLTFFFTLAAFSLTAPLSSFALEAGDSVVCRNEINDEIYTVKLVSKEKAYVRISSRKSVEGNEVRFYPVASVSVFQNQNGNYQVDMRNFDGSNILETLEFPAYVDFGGDGPGAYTSFGTYQPIFCALK